MPISRVQALNRLGATKTMEGFLGYINTIVAREADRDLKPVYGIIPDIPLTEVKVTSLEGYRGMGPVRIGNLAQEQVQNDSYGSIILAAAQMFFDRRLPVRGDLDLSDAAGTAGTEGRGASPSAPMRASGNFAAARRSIPIRRRSAGPAATAWPRSPPASASRSAPSAGGAKPIASARPFSSKAGIRRSAAS